MGVTTPARLRAFFGIASSLVGLGPVARAEAPGIVHDGISCVQADGFPKLQARVEPSEQAATVRAYFRAQGTPHWYFTPLQPSSGGFSGALPKPRKDLEAFEYYIEVTAKDMTTSRTAAFEPRVVSGPVACQGKLLAPMLASAKVIVGAPVGGSPPVPVGFSSAGIVSVGGSAAVASAGSGVSGKTIGIIAGVAALGAGVAVAAAGSSSSSSSAEGGADPCAGGFDFTMDFAYVGTASSVMNPRQQVYRVRNGTGAPLRIEGIEGAFNFTCNASGNSFTLPLAHLVENVPPGATTIVRTGAPAGTGRLICCSSPGAACSAVTFACSYSQQYTVRTSCGAKVLPHSFSLIFTGDLPLCFGTSGEWY